MGVNELERHFRGGETIVECGSAGREMYVVRSGAVRIHQGLNEAPSSLKSGELFGEAALILGQPYDFRAEADGEVTVLPIDLRLLHKLMLECPEFAFRLVHHLAVRAGTASPEHTHPGHASQPDVATPLPDELASSTARGAELLARAVAQALLARATGEEPPIAVPGRLRDLADAAGISVLDAYFCLQGLLDRRLVRLVDDQLTILEPADLRSLAG